MLAFVPEKTVTAYVSGAAFVDTDSSEPGASSSTVCEAASSLSASLAYGYGPVDLAYVSSCFPPLSEGTAPKKLDKAPDKLATFLLIKNCVLSQAVTGYEKKMIADLPRNRLRKLMGHSFRSSSIESMGVKALLPMRSQRSIPIEPQLSEAARKKIGLLRAPGLDESALTDSDYNVAMADEALRLGALVRDVFLAGECPSFKSLWSACRVWRIGRLNSHSEPKEIQMFGNSRIQELASERQGERFIATRFFSNDPLYGHLSGALTKRIHLFDAGALTRQDARAMAFKDDVLANELGRRVSLQHSFPMDHYFVPLTELRVFVSQKGALLRTVWSHTSNIEYDITKDVLDESESRFLTEGIMKHTRARYLPILAGKVQDYLQAFGALVLDEAMALLNHPLQSIDLQDARVVRLLSSLGEIHYLLAQAAFDERGSAAKSELFIRALSASAGVELPAFKAGFVPDLESFLDTQQNFVQQYLNAFEW